MAPVQIYLFGSPHLEYQGEPVEVARRKSLALVAYLALTNRPQSRDVLIVLLWPDLDQEHARSALRSTLHSLTAQIPVEWIIANRQTLSMNYTVVSVDVSQFRNLQLERRSHAHSLETICDLCVDLLMQAVTLYQDDLLAGFGLSDSVEFDDWQAVQREMLRQELGNILNLLIQYYGDDNRKAYDTAIHYARRWLTLNPLNELAHRALMRLYAISGQRADALRQYQECASLLDAELATPPEEETTQLYEQIREAHTSGLNLRTTTPVHSSIPPLPALIVGRESTLKDLKKRLGIDNEGRWSPITVIQGWPGIGKSTIVSALAHDFEIATAFPDGILWVSLGQQPNLIAELVAWGKALNVVEAGISYNLQEIMGLLTATLRDKKVLLIVDDVWRAEHAAAFRVGGQKCVMVMTSRLNEIAQALAPTSRDIYRLSVLDEENGLDLLTRLVPDTVTEYPEEARELVRSLEGLPLAIQVAGRLLYSEMQFGWGIQDLLEELQHGVDLLQAQAPLDIASPLQDATPTIATLLRRSTDALDNPTRQRFAMLGLFRAKPATFDLKAIAALWDIADPKPTIRLLVNQGLLEPMNNGRFQIHALLVLHARSLWEN